MMKLSALTAWLTVAVISLVAITQNTWMDSALPALGVMGLTAAACGIYHAAFGE